MRFIQLTLLLFTVFVNSANADTGLSNEAFSAKVNVSRAAILKDKNEEKKVTEICSNLKGNRFNNNPECVALYQVLHNRMSGKSTQLKF
jgi:hypothetical protein